MYVAGRTTVIDKFVVKGPAEVFGLYGVGYGRHCQQAALTLAAGRRTCFRQENAAEMGATRRVRPFSSPIYLLQVATMFLVDRQTVPATLRDEPATRLKLRVREDGQVIELAEGKTTIGSSPRCNLRLTRPGVEPLHCLVLDGPEGLRVRRWAVDTRLNGEPVEDALLEAGDCLSLGGVELELVGPAPTTESIAEPIADLLPEPVANDDARDPSWEAALPPMPIAIGQQDEKEFEIGVGDASNNEDFAVHPNRDFAEDAVVEIGNQQGTKELLPERDAAELVFRQLQAACGVARSRNRKMLVALRSLRAEKETLVRRIENGEPSNGFDGEPARWETARQTAEQEHHELHLELKELRRQLGEWESRLAEHTQQMADLQQELVAARASGQRLVEDRAVSNDVNSIELPRRLNAPAESEFTTEHKAVRSEAWETSDVDSTADGTAEEGAPVVFDSAPAEAPLTHASHEASVPEEAQAGAGLSAEVVDPWDLPSEPKVDWTTPVERAAWENNEALVSGEDEDDLSPFAEFSIWNQGARAEQINCEEPAALAQEEPAVEAAAAWGSQGFGELADSNAAELEEAVENSVPVEEANPWAAHERAPAADVSPEYAVEMESPAAPVQSTSFIERYSHLFAEEAEVAAEKVEVPVVPPVPATPLPAAPRNASAPIAATSSDDEESIEQYMAKLMKRVRGDNPVVVGSQVAPVAAPMVSESVATATVSTSAEPVDQKATTGPAAEAAPSEEEQAEVAVNWDAFVRRAATAPATNLGALRALANATARGDISRHQLKKHRRDAVTKVIVSTLAGMTSLWLMLDAENWRSIQFVTACISLLVAAYWAGEAFREMVRSMRDVYAGPRSDEAEPAALPIDVEG